MAANYEKSIYNQLMDVMARLDTVESDLRVEKIEHKKDVVRLNKKIDELEKENKILRDDNERLKSIINNDSSNTSCPPSTDQKGSKSSNTYNSRTKSKRKSGGQNGHKGTTLTKAEVEEKIKSGNCRHEIKDIGDKSSKTYVTKYVVDIDVKTLITELHIYADKDGHFAIPLEYHSDVVYGANVKALAVALYSEGVMANDRIAAFLNAASDNNLGLSNGSIYNFCKKMSECAVKSIQNLETDLRNQNVVSTDATVVTTNGKQSYIRNFSISKTVIYRTMKEKSIDALHKIDFLERFAGTLVHDHETALYHFGADHAECNVHIIRYLRKNSEDSGNKWSDQMKTLLCDANTQRKKVMENGLTEFDTDTIFSYETRYQNLVADGREANKKTKHKYAKKEEKTLLNRLEKYQKNHLLFLHNFEVPFDNNLSERDLRKVKNRQKMAGGFRKDSGSEMYCSILTIVETLKRRGMAIMENLKQLFLGTPAIF